MQKHKKIMKKVVKKKSKIDSIVKTREFKKKLVKNNEKSILPGIKDFWKQKSAASSNLSKKTTPNYDTTKSKRLTASERYQRYIDDEERIRNIEENLANPELEPSSSEQFERVLMNDKNNSFMWIKYMAFHLETAETDKARAIAKKAIASINFREENELVNVWIAYINLEIRYGTDETYQEVLREATQRNDGFKIYSKVLTILLDLDKFEEANKIVDVLKKKFKPNPEMWLLVSESYLRMDKEKLAKEILPKSLLSLNEKDRKNFMLNFKISK
jgi:rRNA biogenesis protein RRP5